MNSLINGVINIASSEIKIGASEYEVYNILNRQFHPSVSTVDNYSYLTIDHVDFFDILCEYEFMFCNHILKRVYISPSLEEAKLAKTRDGFYTAVRNIYDVLIASLITHSEPRTTQGNTKDYKCFYYTGCRLKISIARDYESVSAVLEAFHE